MINNYLAIRRVASNLVKACIIAQKFTVVSAFTGASSKFYSTKYFLPFGGGARVAIRAENDTARCSLVLPPSNITWT